jgi:hypothetical protein
MWLGSIWRFYACLIGAALVGLATVAYHPIEVLFLVPTYLCQLALFTLAGVYLSMWRLTPFQARFLVGTLFFVGLFVLPSFIYPWLVDLPFCVTMFMCPYQSWSLIYHSLDVSGTLAMDTSYGRPLQVGGRTVIEGIVVSLGLTLLLLLCARNRLVRMQERVT